MKPLKLLRQRSLRRPRAICRALGRVINSNPYMEESAKALPSALNSLCEPLYGVSMSSVVSSARVRVSRARAGRELKLRRIV